MTLRTFNRIFGIEADLAAEKRRFVERINQTVFTILYNEPPFPDSYEDLFRGVCYHLGIDAGRLIAATPQQTYGPLQVPPPWSLTHDDFMETLKVLVMMYEVVRSPEGASIIDKCIRAGLTMTTTDLGVRWAVGMFYPSGAKELDEKLIGDNLDWLSGRPDVRSQFARALEHFSHSYSDPSARKDAITNAFSAIERLAREALGNNKVFDNNSDALVEFLELPKEYRNIFFYYRRIAHGYSSRHAGTQCSHLETETFIYLTGLLMRLINESIAEERPS
jgi:hypothetical protein